MFHEAMKGRPWVIAHAGYHSVLDWIPVDVINAPVEIVLVDARVLPNRRCQTARSDLRKREVVVGPSVPPAARWARVKPSFDLPNPRRIVVVPRWQGPDEMNMVRQQNHRLDREWSLRFDDLQRVTQ
ncbi:MAG TPA: hypothetical protein VFE62_28635 [Gemmataceae bacterium]|nr:hypothetical protein [Gemmataceae bacterium]